ncbi:MAG: hypothetical protein C4529_11095 [Deltaproteobacteria bacterium]|nr:MAG: hypothetical protein C4529_11095 [Deltaproteobacteria bacterium]
MIDRGFQFNLAWHYLLVVAFFFGVGLVLVFLPSAYVLLTTDDLKSLEPAVAEFFVLHKRIWPAAIVTLAGVFLYSFLIGHRIAGPVYRINQVLRQLLRGEHPGKVEFRSPDYFHDTARLLEELSGAISRERSRGDGGEAKPSGGETRR